MNNKKLKEIYNVVLKFYIQCKSWNYSCMIHVQINFKRNKTNKIRNKDCINMWSSFRTFRNLSYPMKVLI